MGEFKGIIIQDLTGQKLKTFWRVLGWGREDGTTCIRQYQMTNPQINYEYLKLDSELLDDK